MSRAAELRNDDTERSCRQADGYFLGASPEGDLVIAFDVAGEPEFGLFFNAESARDFLNRFTAEMQEMGWLS